MNPELEILLAALDDWLEATDGAGAAQARFDALVDDALAKRRGVDREQFVRALMNRRSRHVRAELRQPPSLPPSA